jgi:sterol 3beta-glucosyltransferase
MKVTLLTSGTRGDTQPFIALGKALKEQGAEVYIAATEGFKSLVEDNGLNYKTVEGDVASIIASGKFDDVLEADNPIKAIQGLKFPEFREALLKITEDLYHAAQGSDALIYHPGAAVGYFAAEDLGIPGFLGSPFPMHPTSEYPSLLFYKQRLPKILNRFTHWIFAKGFSSAAMMPVKRLYRERLKQKRKFKNPLIHAKECLISCSNSVFNSPPPAKSFGWWFLDEKHYEPPRGLEDFLQADEKPLYIGFGSVGNVTKAEEHTKIFLEALKQTGKRAVLSKGWGGLSVENLPDNVYPIEEAPHSWLFPRVSGVIHHGGAGTSAAGFRAGVPSIIIPHGNDQFAWAWRAYELGIGSKPVYQKNLSVSAIVQAIGEIGDPEVIQRSAELGEKIRAERGAEKTAEYVLSQLRKMS